MRPNLGYAHFPTNDDDEKSPEEEEDFELPVS